MRVIGEDGQPSVLPYGQHTHNTTEGDTMASSVGERVAVAGVVVGLSFMFLVTVFGLSDAGQTLTYVANTGDFAGYLYHGVDEDHWTVALGMELYNLANR